MDIELSPEDQSFRDDVRAFLSENAYKPGSDYNEWRMGWFAKAREKGGWDVPKWPVEFGGPGWSPTQHYIWEKETAVATLPFDLPFGLSMLAPVLMGYGSKEQQERFLPDIRARKVNWCQGYSEPGAGSDLASPEDQGGTLRRWLSLRRQRHQNLDHPRPHRRLDLLSDPHGRFRHQTGRHHLSAVSDETGRHRGQTHHHPGRCALRKHRISHRCQSTGGKPGRRRRQRLDLRERTAAARTHRARRHFPIDHCPRRTQEPGPQREARQRLTDGRPGFQVPDRRTRSRSAARPNTPNCAAWPAHPRVRHPDPNHRSSSSRAPRFSSAYRNSPSKQVAFSPRPGAANRRARHSPEAA